MDRIATMLLDGDSRRPACAVVSDDVDPLKQVLFGVEFPRPVVMRSCVTLWRCMPMVRAWLLALTRTASCCIC